MTELEKWKTHMECDGCIYLDSDDVAEPCISCIGTTTYDSPDRLKRKDNFCSEAEAKFLQTNDVVNHPSHYTQGKIECIDAMESAFGAENTAVYCKINAFKYIWRSEYKNGLEDLKKALWYIKKAIELKEGTK